MPFETFLSVAFLADVLEARDVSSLDIRKCVTQKSQIADKNSWGVIHAIKFFMPIYCTLNALHAFAPAIPVLKKILTTNP